jgi:mRNA interferase RelE/StbE
MKLKEGLKLTRAERFKRCVLDLDPRAREKLRKQLGILILNPRHPSLGVKKIRGTKSIFEARLDDHYRFTFEYGEKNEIILRVVGPHNSALKKP